MQSLPVGLQTEFSYLFLFIKIFFTLLSIFILFFGYRFTRIANGFFLTILGYFLVKAFNISNYFLQMVGVLIILSIIMIIYLLIPRFFTALLMLIASMVIYSVSIYFGGDIKINWVVMIILSIISVLIGIIFIRYSIILYSSFISALLLIVQWENLRKAYIYVLISMIGIIVQSLSYSFNFKLFRGYELNYRERRLRLIKDLRNTILVAAIAIFIFFIILVIFSPRIKPLNYYYLNKLNRIKQDGIFNKPSLIIGSEYNYYLYGRAVPISFIAKNRTIFNRIKVIIIGKDIRRDLIKYRVIKDNYEIEKIKKACEITSEAMQEAGKMIRIGINESDIEKKIIEVFKNNGVKSIAFKSIIASGENALLPHYDKNNAELRAGFVVVDIGCMIDGYSSDMTRTFPVNRKYSKGQLELMKLVLKVKQLMVDKLKPGISLRKLNGEAKDLFQEAGFGKYYIHALSHHVGINVHDPNEDILKEGMIITIEPGIYIPEDMSVNKEYWDIGIRIEDTYLITKTGAEQLTNYSQIPFLDSGG